MTTQTEALKLALEAVEEAVDCAKHGYISNYLDDWENAIAAIKEALAQPEQEPVATVISETGADIKMSWWHEPALPIGTKLYTTPYVATPRPQRKPLTDEQINEVLDSMKLLVPSRIARAIEAAHGIKE